MFIISIHIFFYLLLFYWFSDHLLIEELTVTVSAGTNSGHISSFWHTLQDDKICLIKLSRFWSDLVRFGSIWLLEWPIGNWTFQASRIRPFVPRSKSSNCGTVSPWNKLSFLAAYCIEQEVKVPCRSMDCRSSSNNKVHPSMTEYHALTERYCELSKDVQNAAFWLWHKPTILLQLIYSPLVGSQPSNLLFGCVQSLLLWKPCSWFSIVNWTLSISTRNN